jgi:hypothetical protein
MDQLEFQKFLCKMNFCVAFASLSTVLIVTGAIVDTIKGFRKIILLDGNLLKPSNPYCGWTDRPTGCRGIKIQPR